MDFSSDSSKLACSDGGHAIRLFDVESKREEHRLQGHNDTVTDLAFLANGTRIITSGYDQTLRVWDPSRGEAVLTIPVSDQVWTFAMSSSDRILVYGEVGTGLNRVIEIPTEE